MLQASMMQRPQYCKQASHTSGQQLKCSNGQLSQLQLVQIMPQQMQQQLGRQAGLLTMWMHRHMQQQCVRRSSPQQMLQLVERSWEHPVWQCRLYQKWPGSVQ
jgi:hypothetical protein